MKVKCIRAILLITGFCFLINTGHTQSPALTGDLKNIVTPSPNASALGQYGNTPVGFYTGTSQVSVPLYEISEGSLKLPISLSYNAGGIKISEFASWTGLGWTLNAGGAITRTVYGMPDEGSINAFYTISPNPTLTSLKASLNRTIDGQPDIFYFNFNGKSGKFIIGKTSLISITPHQNLKIQAYNGGGAIINPPFTGLSVPITFRITDEDGIVYEFKNYETNRTITYDPNVTQNPSVFGAGNPLASLNAWYMTDMYSPTGDTIKFTYGNYALSYDLPSCEQRFIPVGQQGEVNASPVQPATVMSVTRSQNQNLRLQKISFSNGSIIFNANTPRADLIGDTALNNISIYNSKNSLIKGFAFNYTYSTGSGFSNYISIQPNDDNYYESNVNTNISGASKRRLMLTEVSELDNNNIADGKNYSFSYTGGGLPDRFSKARDYWGYSNGSADNENIYLSYQYNGTDPTNPANYLIVGKEPNLSYCQQNTLSSIKYPTGGSTQFNYELHTAFMGRGVLPPATIPQNCSMSIDYSMYSTLPYKDTLVNGVHCKVQTFSINTAGTNVNILIAGLLPQGPGYSMKFDIYDSTNSDVLSMSSIANNSSTTVTITPYTNPATGVTSNTKSYALTNYFPYGTYRVIFTPIGSYIGNTNYHDIYGYNGTISISGWSNLIVYTDSINIIRNIGGLRTHSTVDFDPITNKYLQKTYSYALPNDTLTSGTLVSGANYIYKFNQIVNTVDDNTMYVALYNYIVINGESNYPLSTTQGSNVGYSTVTVTQSDPVSGSVNGKSEMHYTNPAQFPDCYGTSPGYLYYGFEQEPSTGYSPAYGPVSPYPYPPADTRDWQRGLLLQKTDYSYNGNTFSPVKIENYTYTQPVYLDTVIGFVARYAQQLYPSTADTIAYDIDGTGVLTWQEIYATRNYSFSSGYVLLTNKSVTNIGTDGSTELSTENYTYGDVPSNMLPTITSGTDSKGNTVTTYSKYPFDYTVTSAATLPAAAGIYNLQNNHILNPAIEKYSQKTSSTGTNIGVTGGTYMAFSPTQPLVDTIYKLLITSPLTMYSPVSVSNTASVMDAHYTPMVSFDKYDVKGNLLQQHKVNDLSYSYVWDYYNKYPIAQAINASQSNIAFTSFEADGSGNWTIPSAVRDSLNFITGTLSYNLSNGAISKTGLTSGTIYLVTYWSRNGSYSIGGGSVSSRTGRNVNGWTYYEHTITASSTTITITGSGNIDELRLFPQGAMMTTYTFAPLVGQTSMADPNSEITYYEYDGLQRLKNVKDYQGNIIKNYQYNYGNSCGTNCSVLPMQTMSGTNTISYPVGVFNVNGKLLGNATTQSQYITLWMADTADSHTGTIVAGTDSMHFNFTLNTGRLVPSSLTGLRYYQFDLSYNVIDALRIENAAYIDFGDGTGFRINTAPSTGLPANTTINFFPNPITPYYIHTYPNNNLKTITLYHNDSNENSDLDNFNNPSTSLDSIKNLRGNLPQLTTVLGGSGYQQPSMNTIANITNWNSINSLLYFSPGNGDNADPCMHMNFAQDFMASNKGLQYIHTSVYGPYRTGYRDTTFKISRLKSDWNTYFTNLTDIRINEDHWNHEDLSSLKNLNSFELTATTISHQDVNGQALIPLSASVIDNSINQIASGAGNAGVKNGVISYFTGGVVRTSASNAAVTQLKAAGWVIYLDGVAQ